MTDESKRFGVFVLRNGLFMEKVKPPSDMRDLPARYEIVDLAGNLHGRGHNPDSAIDAVYTKFQKSHNPS